MVIEISIESTCPSCDYPIKVVATTYKIHNRDGSSHTCNCDELTFTDCSEYTLCRFGDETFSRCKFTGTYCEADEAGLECHMWEEEKAEILKEGQGG